MIFTTNVADGRKMTNEFETDALVFSDWVGVYTWDTKAYSITVTRKNYDGTVYVETPTAVLLGPDIGDNPRGRAKNYLKFE